MDPIIELVSSVIEAYDQHQRELREQELLDKVRDISSKVNEILAYCEQDILREIYSAYDAIITAEITENSQTKALRLNYAENQLLKNTQLNRSLSTADHPNTYWVALSNFGLVIICILREDRDTAFIHLLKTFEADPHFARSELAPTTYKLLFAETIDQGLQEFYTSSLKEIEHKDYHWEAFERKCLAGAMAGGGIALGIIVGLFGGAGVAGGIAYQATHEAEGTWEGATPEKILEGKKEAFKLQFNEKRETLVDQFCQELAKNYLKEGLSLQSIRGIVEPVLREGGST